MDIKQKIKDLVSKENTSLTEVVKILNSTKSENEKTTVQNLNNKLTRGTIKFSEVIEIADILGYEVVFQKTTPEQLKKRVMASTFANDLSESITAGVAVGSVVGHAGGLFGSILSNVFGLKEKDEQTITHEIEITPEQSKQIRKSFEMAITYEISELLDKILEYSISNFNLDERLKQILEHIRSQGDTFAISSKLDDCYVILNNLFLSSHKYMNVSMILGHLRVIYKHGGLESLSDDDLNELLNTIREYNENDLFIK